MQTNLSLTSRELEIVQLSHDGYNPREIADKLFISKRTVDFHVGNILSKLQVSDKLKAIAECRKAGLLS